MKAVRIDRPTRGADVVLVDAPVPAAKPGWVLVEVDAFGLNDSERQFRASEITQDWIPKPIVPGVECAGIVRDASDTDLASGQRVIACMGGLGCAYDGSYAEYVLVPRENVFTVPDAVAWNSVELAALPETYSTAWGSLIGCMQLQPADLLVVRGATCALGYASMQLARALGCRIVATTHKTEKLAILEELDVEEALVDDGLLDGKLGEVDKILDLVGPSTLRDTLKAASPGAIVCSTGFLGGHLSLDDFDPVSDIPNGVHLTAYSSSNPDQALYDDLFEFMMSFNLRPIVGHVFEFDRIREALCAQDAGIDGKIVVKVRG